MTSFTPYSSLIGGVLIGLSATLLMLFNGRISGISTIMNNVVFGERGQRLWCGFFLIGLILSGLLMSQLAPDLNLPRQQYPMSILALGGFFVGLGARTANGCVSGHGICGLAKLSRRSMLATGLFMLLGMVSVFILRHLIGVQA